MLLECCVDSLAAARAAALGGADRIEFCARLDIGGITPDPATLDAALAQLVIPVFPMVRPRGGDFCYSSHETTTMLAELRRLRATGVQGAVVGALTIAGAVDRDAMTRCRDAAGPDMQLTFHRAFDVARDPFAALDTLIDLGFARVLTSGQRATAWEGRELISQLVKRAAGRIVVMPGGGITADNARAIVERTAAGDIHFSAHDAAKVQAIRRSIG